MEQHGELHVVYGYGPVGRAVVETLLARQRRVRVVTHSGQRRDLPAEVEVVRGDATDTASTTVTCRGATHVYNCTNPRDYHRWPEQFPPLMHGILHGAAANDAKLIVMENLYMYGPHDGAPMTETTRMCGRGSRSSTRKQLTIDLFDAHRAGKVRAASVRASDLFGPFVTESLVGERLFQPLLNGKAASVFADLDLPHTVSYVGDVGRALVAVGADDRALGRAWHAPNAPTVSLRTFVGLLGEEAGIHPQVRALPRVATSLLLPLMGAFVPPLRGLTENLYISYEPYIVDHSQYEQHFGTAATPLRDALRTTVQWYRAHQTMRAVQPA